MAEITKTGTPVTLWFRIGDTVLCEDGWAKVIGCDPDLHPGPCVTLSTPSGIKKKLLNQIAPVTNELLRKLGKEENR